MHPIKLLLGMIACAWSAHAAEEITGRVVNGSAAALANAKVWLKGRPELADSTGADGRFSLSLGTSALGPGIGGRSVAERTIGIGFRVPRLVFAARGDGGKSSGRFDASGRAAPLPSESRALPLQDRASADANAPVPAADAPLAKAAAVGDTLIVLRMGYEIKKTALIDLSAKDVGDIGLKPRSFVRDAAVAVKTGRRVEVYVPSDYKELYALPVLYLLHGGGADETYWRQNCKFLDSLNSFADKVNVQPMIIVTPSAGGNTNYGYYGKTADPFYTDLTVDIRAWVESHYKADTARSARAISGLSMGSMQSWNLTLFYPKLWGWSLPMSGGLFKSVGFTPAKLKADAAAKTVDVTALNEIKLFKIYTNPTDIAFGDTDSTTMLADTLGIKHLKDFTTKTSGGHTDPFWNEVFRKYAPLIFK